MNSESSKNKILDTVNPGEYFEGQEVNLIIKDKTDLGYKAIINEKHWGVIYKNEVFQVLEKNQKIKGFIKKIREDGRIDLTIYKIGHHGADDVGPKIIEALEQNQGFLPITDKTLPEYIYDQFGVSKKKFKIAVSGLYKKRAITLEKDGIRLISKSKK